MISSLIKMKWFVYLWGMGFVQHGRFVVLAVFRQSRKCLIDLIILFLKFFKKGLTHGLTHAFKLMVLTVIFHNQVLRYTDVYIYRLFWLHKLEAFNSCAFFLFWGFIAAAVRYKTSNGFQCSIGKVLKSEIIR